MAIDNLANRYVISTGRVVMPSALPQQKINSPGSHGQPFGEIFREKIDAGKKLTFSKHAQLRISERQMDLSPEQLAKMDSAVRKADQKGVKDTLILMDQMAFIVNVPSTTVVTAMSGEDLKDNVFTKIDGAVIV